MMCALPAEAGLLCYERRPDSTVTWTDAGTPALRASITRTLLAFAFL